MPHILYIQMNMKFKELCHKYTITFSLSNRLLDAFHFTAIGVAIIKGF